jgi:polysaccharide biosynthesis/export protein
MKFLILSKLSHLHAFAATICLIALLTGCQSSPYPKTEPYTELQPVPSPRLLFVPGDDIEIRFTYAMQFSTSLTVRPDGKIQLPLLEQPEVMVQGKTPVELREELIKLYAPHLKHPELVVIARAFYDRRVYVGGSVNEPGTVSMPGRLTALDAIMQAGGFDTLSAKVKNVIVIRHRDGQRYGCALDFRDTLKGKEVKPFYLEPLDIVFVPETNIYKINRWIDQYINKIVPQTGFLYTHSTGHRTVGIQTDAYNVK